MLHCGSTPAGLYCRMGPHHRTAVTDDVEVDPSSQWSPEYDVRRVVTQLEASHCHADTSRQRPSRGLSGARVVRRGKATGLPEPNGSPPRTRKRSLHPRDSEPHARQNVHPSRVRPGHAHRPPDRHRAGFCVGLARRRNRRRYGHRPRRCGGATSLAQIQGPVDITRPCRRQTPTKRVGSVWTIG